MKFAYLAALLALVACGQPAPPPGAPKADVVAPDGAPTPAPQARTDAEIAAKIATLPAPYNAGAYENGRRMFAQCRACHGMFGRPAGVVPGFNSYSAPLKQSGIVWDEAKLDAWVENPRDLVPGTTMIYPGLRKPEDRRDLVAYLKVETE
jgi:cytochrome c